jgi:hypothetical protein
MSKYRDFQKMLSTWFNTLGPDKGSTGTRQQVKRTCISPISYSRTYYSLVAPVGQYRRHPDPDTKQDIYDTLNKRPGLDVEDLSKLWDLLMTQPHYESRL